MRSKLIGIAALLAVAGTASGGALEDVLMRQKSGFWEATTSATGKKTYFCVTESVKIDAQKQTLDSFKELGCRTVKDVRNGDDYEVHLDCANPTFDKFQMTMRGTVRTDFMRDSGTITGDHEFIQSMAKNPDLQGVEWRWLRPCKPGEKPGPQD